MKTSKKILISICILTIIALTIYITPQIYTLFNNFITNTGTNTISLSSNGNLIDENDVTSLEDSGLTGDSYTFDTTYYPYYGYLSSSEKEVYKQIYANILEVETTLVPVNSITTNQAAIIIESIYNDHPELFWLNTSYSYKYTKNDQCVQITLSYNKTSYDLDKYQALFDNSANTIIEKAKLLSSDYEKEKYVHNAIINLVSYNENAEMNQSAYSALVNHETVCSGYARAFQYIMIKLGIPTYYVTGYAKEDHAWNIVKLDGEYYNVDLTWDDQNTIIYTYFNVPDSIFNTTHTRSTLSSKLPTCSGTKYYTTTNNTTSNNNEEKTESNDNSTSNEEIINNNEELTDETETITYPNNEFTPQTFDEQYNKTNPNNKQENIHN